MAKPCNVTVAAPLPPAPALVSGDCPVVFSTGAPWLPATVPSPPRPPMAPLPPMACTPLTAPPPAPPASMPPPRPPPFW
ncbi:hypothetical protein CEK29_19225 [Bordetella genomosp. 5]|nr:hypothetical protein CEK29_19225 [Bordetella genomosp. 5]